MSAPKVMRAAILHGPEDLAIEEVPVPEPRAGEIVVRVEAALAGGNSAQVYRRGRHARRGSPPLRLGHEGAGVVEAVGSGVARWKVGDRVVPSSSAACGRCGACERGHTTQCEDMVWSHGFFAEHIRVPARIAANETLPLPAEMPAEAAGLAETLAAVVKGHDRTPVRRGERALVIGAGVAGLLWVRLLRVSGARVTAVEPRADRRETALVLGAEQALAPGEFEPGAIRADLVVEAAGSTKAWESALAAATPGCRVNLFGDPPAGTTVALDTERLRYDELLVTTSFHHTSFHFAEALRLLAEGFVDPKLFVQERIELDELPAFFERTGSGNGPLKAAVMPRGS
jgi:L-iditol 2-dehydrogenase